MKRILFLFSILLVIGCASAFAQRGGGATARGGNNGGNNPNNDGAAAGRENRPNRNDQAGATANGGGDRRAGGIGGALRNLNLTDAQKQQIRDIQQTAKQNGTDRKVVAEQVKAVLTPEQIGKLEKRKEKMKEKRKEKRKDRQDQTNSSDTPPSNN